MRIIASPEQVKIVEIDDFKKFHIEASGRLEHTAVQFTQAGAGRVLNADQAEVSISFIEQQAGSRLQDEIWVQGLKQMLDYALSKGWINAQHQAVIGHIEWAEAVQQG